MSNFIIALLYSIHSNLNKIEESKYFIYCNPAYFSNIFKKYIVMTPSEFRVSK